MEKKWQEGTLVTVDRIEDGIVALELEDESIVELPISELPSELKEGYILRFQNEKWEIDREAYEERLAQIEEFFQEFF